jgi:hypothetical protein
MQCALLLSDVQYVDLFANDGFEQICEVVARKG